MAPAALVLYRALVAAALPVAAPWLLLGARTRHRSRPPLAQRLGRHLPPVPSGSVWVQAVSVGEVAVARPLLVELRRRRPELPLVLSSTTGSGLQLARSHAVADQVVPFPLDLPGVVRRFLDALAPRLVVLVETELWPELLHACARRGTPVAVVNARVSDASFRGYYAARRLLRPLLRPLTLVLAQEAQDASRLAAMGVPAERIRLSGNIKFDSSPPGAPSAAVEALRSVAAGRAVWVAGSTVEGEEEAVLDALLDLPAPTRPFLVLAPRHPERAAHALEAAARRGLRAFRRTAVEQAVPGDEVVVLDTIGELAALYELATVAFVGGSLTGGGGHNPIEPARFGVGVLTGPNVRNFASIYRSFLDEGAARVVQDAGELTAAVAAWLADPAAARRAGEAGRAILARHAGATARTVDALEPLL